jgi:hypothetical protein
MRSVLILVGAKHPVLSYTFRPFILLYLAIQEKNLKEDGER